LNRQDNDVKALRVSSNNYFFTSQRGGRVSGRSISNNNGSFSYKKFKDNQSFNSQKETNDMTIIILYFPRQSQWTNQKLNASSVISLDIKMLYKFE
jgi:hypothetical protein